MNNVDFVMSPSLQLTDLSNCIFSHYSQLYFINCNYSIVHFLHHCLYHFLMTLKCAGS